MANCVFNFLRISRHVSRMAKPINAFSTCKISVLQLHLATKFSFTVLHQCLQYVQKIVLFGQIGYFTKHLSTTRCIYPNSLFSSLFLPRPSSPTFSLLSHVPSSISTFVSSVVPHLISMDSYP